jgi:hypothetical protein
MVRLLRTVVWAAAGCDCDQAEDGQKDQFAHQRLSAQMADTTRILSGQFGR